jgi:hypothetical protein
MKAMLFAVGCMPLLGGAMEENMSTTKDEMSRNLEAYEILQREQREVLRLREALEEIKALAGTYLKPDMYPTEESWQRSKLQDIEWKAKRALEYPKPLRADQDDVRQSDPYRRMA